MKLYIASPRAVEFACRYYHYAESIPAAALAYSVFNKKNEFCGVVVFGYGATPNIVRPYNKWQGQVAELVRVALNGKQESTSKALAVSLKLLKRDAPLVDIVISYADKDQSHAGTIYQATNWIYTGLQNENTRGAFIVNGQRMHPRSVGAKGWVQSLEWLKINIDSEASEFITEGKHKYVFPMNDKARKLLELLAQPYPKKGEGIPNKGALKPLPQKESVKARLQDLGPRLLKANYKAKWSEDNPCWGYCYLVSEAVYHYCLEKTVPRCVNLGEGYGNHWFLDKNGEPVDYTAEQFGFKVPHHKGIKRQFMKGSVKTERGAISKRGYEMARWLGLA